MESFNPIKRIQPVQQDRNIGQGINPNQFVLPEEETAIDAFGKLLGVLPAVHKQWSKEEEEKQLEESERILNENEGKLAELYSKYRAAEKAGEVPAGYSPFLYRAVRRNLGGRMARKVGEVLSTEVMAQIEAGEHADADLDELYAATVESVLQSQLGIEGGLDSVDSDFDLAFSMEAKQVYEKFKQEGFKKNGEVRLRAAASEAKAGIVEGLKTGFDSSAAFTEWFLDYKNKWRQAGLPDGYLGEALVESVQARVSLLIEEAKANEDIKALGEAEEFLEIIANGTANPFAKKGAEEKKLESRWAKEFGDMREALFKAEAALSDSETSSRVISGIRSTAKDAIKASIEANIGNWLIADEAGAYSFDAAKTEAFQDRMDSIWGIVDPNGDLKSPTMRQELIDSVMLEVIQEQNSTEFTQDRRVYQTLVDGERAEASKAYHGNNSTTFDLAAKAKELVEEADPQVRRAKTEVWSEILGKITSDRRAGRSALAMAAGPTSVYTRAQTTSDRLIGELVEGATDELKAGLEPLFANFLERKHSQEMDRILDETPFFQLAQPDPTSLVEMFSGDNYDSLMREFLRTDKAAARLVTEHNAVMKSFEVEEATPADSLSPIALDLPALQGWASAFPGPSNSSAYATVVNGMRAAGEVEHEFKVAFEDDGERFDPKVLTHLRDAVGIQDALVASAPWIRRSATGRVTLDPEGALEALGGDTAANRRHLANMNRTVTTLNAQQDLLHVLDGSISRGEWTEHGVILPNGRLIAHSAIDPRFHVMVPGLRDSGFEPSTIDRWALEWKEHGEREGFADTEFGQYWASLPKGFTVRYSPYEYLLYQGLLVNKLYGTQTKAGD